MGENYLSNPKLQRLQIWGLEIDTYLHPTLLNGYDFLSLLGLKFKHVSKRGPWIHLPASSYVKVKAAWFVIRH